jgi:hypothetical protein
MYGWKPSALGLDFLWCRGIFDQTSKTTPIIINKQSYGIRSFDNNLHRLIGPW